MEWKAEMIIRKYQSTDCESLANLFYQTVHTINTADYTSEQLNAWADGKVNLSEWDRTLSEHYSLVAEEDNVIVGFGDIDKTGYLDRLYVHKDFQNKGIATVICNKLEQEVDADRITVHASITAKSFFVSRGYKIIKEQQVIRNGVSLTNYVMEKNQSN